MLVYLAAHKIAEGKIERDDENYADRVGLLIAAQAGYHPDFAIQLTRVMREEHPDKSKFVTFFMSDHPRWATREDKIEKNYDQALSAFNARWPVVAQSPGGMPPQVTTSQARNAPVPTPELRHIVRASESVPQAPALQAVNPTPIPGFRERDPHIESTRSSGLVQSNGGVLHALRDKASSPEVQRHDETGRIC
jgi:hypothetical protein